MRSGVPYPACRVSRSCPACLAVCLALAGFPEGSPGAEDYVSEPAGFVRVQIASNTALLVSLPFAPFHSSVEGVLSNQLTGATNPAQADQLLQWDNVAQEYVVSFKADGTGDSNKDGRWFDTNWVASTQTLNTGEGFWIQNRHEVQNVFLGGAVVLSDTQTTAFLQGLNAFGYPYSSRIGINDSDLSADGTFGATNANFADQVQDSSSNIYWLLNKPGDENDGKWLDATGVVSSLDFHMGAGFWYDRILTNGLWWSEMRPYSNVFDVGTNAPQIASLQVGTNHDRITLTLSCSGITGETMEVFYKDLASSNEFVSESGWLLADQNLASTGGTSLIWTDASSSGRESVTSVFCRVYLVGRQDIDTDVDGLSDAREKFVHQTDPNSADTDGDSINDGAEILRGTDPTNPASSHVTLYAASSIGDNGYDGLTPTVTNGHGPKLNINAAITAAYSGDTVCVSTGIYTEAVFELGAKSLVLVPAGNVRVR